MWAGEPSCTLWVDRSVHKTAGTTVRSAMAALHRAGYLQMLPSHMPSPNAVRELVQTLAQFEEPNCSPALRYTRIALQAHEGQTGFVKYNMCPSCTQMFVVPSYVTVGNITSLVQ